MSSSNPALSRQPATQEAAHAASFEQTAAMVLARLQRAVTDLLAATPGDLRRAADVERAFNVDTKLGWQIHRIATSTNPLATGTSVPAPVSVEKLLKSATRLGVERGAIARAAAAFQEFEKLVEEYAGDRDRFLTMVAPLANEDSEALDLKHKKAMYRAMAHITGVDTQADMFTTLHCPGKAPGEFSAVMLRTAVGLHRFRSGAPLRMSVGVVRTSGAENWNSAPAMAPMMTPIGETPQTPQAYLLREYCTRDFSGEARVIGAGTPFPMLEIPESIGRKNRVTLATASLATNLVLDDPIVWSTPRCRLPAEALVSDVLIHRDAHPVKHPVPTSVRVFNNERIGIGSGEPDYVETTDLLDMTERCEYLGCGVDLLHTPDSPRHVDMLKSVCTAMNLSPDDFHAYRTRVAYPILRSTIRTEFDLGGKTA